MSSTGTPSQQSPSTKAAILSRGFKFWSANKKDVTHQDQESTENEQPQSQSDRTQRRQQVYTAQKYAPPTHSTACLTSYIGSIATGKLNTYKALKQRLPDCSTWKQW